MYDLIERLRHMREKHYRKELKRCLRDHLYAEFWEDTRGEVPARYFQTKFGISTPERAFSAIEWQIKRTLARMDKHGYTYRDLLNEYPLTYRHEAPYVPSPPHLRRVK